MIAGASALGQVGILCTTCMITPVAGGTALAVTGDLTLRDGRQIDNDESCCYDPHAHRVHILVALSDGRVFDFLGGFDPHGDLILECRWPGDEARLRQRNLLHRLSPTQLDVTETILSADPPYHVHLTLHRT